MAKTFKSQRARFEFQLFIDRHTKWILDCARLGNWAPRENIIVEKPLTDAAMSIDIDYKYLEFTLRLNSEFSAAAWEKQDYWRLIRYLCHEYAHIVVEEIDDKITYHKKHTSSDVRFYFERVTEHTGRWLYDLYQHYTKSLDIDIATGQAKSFDNFLKTNRAQNYK